MGFTSDLTATPFDRANAFLKLLSHPDYDVCLPSLLNPPPIPFAAL